MNDWLFLLPVISAFAGWFIAWLAYRLLINSSRLHEKFRSEINGLLNTTLQEGTDLEKKITSPSLLRTSTPLIEKHVDDFLRVRLSKEMPFITHFIGDKTMDSLKKMFMDELETLFPEVMKGFVSNIRDDLGAGSSPKTINAGQSREKFRELLYRSLSGDASKIMIIASLVGFFFGVLELVLLYLIL